MSYQQLRCDSDSDDINFDGKSVEEAGPSTSTSASTSLCRPPSKRQKVSRRLPVDFDSTTEEEQEDDVDFQVNISLTVLIFTRTNKQLTKSCYFVQYIRVGNLMLPRAVIQFVRGISG